MEIDKYDKANLAHILESIKDLKDSNSAFVESKRIKYTGNVGSPEVITVLLYLIKIGIIPSKIKKNCNTCGARYNHDLCKNCDDLLSNWIPRKPKQYEKILRDHGNA